MKVWKGVQSSSYYLVQTMEQFHEFYDLLSKQKIIAYDTETSGLNWVKNRACGFTFGWGIENNYYLPFDHKTGEEQLDINLIREPIRKILEDESITKLFWHEKFDRHFSLNETLNINGIRHDGQIMIHLLDENDSAALKDVAVKYISPHADKWEKALDVWRTEEAKRRRHNFSALLIDELDRKRIELETEFHATHPMLKFSGITKQQLAAHLKEFVKEKLKDHPFAKNKKEDVTYDQVVLDVMAPYTCADVHYTFILWKELLTRVASHESLKKLYIKEERLSDLLFRVERGGIKIDRHYLESLIDPYTKAANEISKRTYSHVGYEFDIDSPVQLIQAFSKKGIVLDKLTKKGKELAKSGLPVEEKNFSVDKKVLEKLALTHPFVKDIVEYRDKKKTLNTNIIGILNLLDENDYVHTTFNANVSTGRMSSKEPNLQNIPAKEKTIRKAFIVPDTDEYVFLFADYSQIELRLLAHHSQDDILLAAYSPKHPNWMGHEQDIHSITCADIVMKRPLSEVLAIKNDPKHAEYNDIVWFRKIAKQVNFGIAYGAGPDIIQAQVSTPERQVSRAECELYIEQYFQKYIGVKNWIESVNFLARNQGFLQNSFGRYRRLPSIRSSQFWERQRAARQFVNFLIQGDAADLFKQAVVSVDEFLRSEKAKTRIVNFVHDETQFYLHKKEIYLLPKIKKIMEDFPQFTVPIIVEMEMSTRDWSSKKPIRKE